MRTFEHPSNGYKEEVGFGASAAVFFLGAMYLVVKGLWRHVFIWLAVVVPISIMTGGVGFVLMVPVACFMYAVMIQDILAKDYLAKGWKETTVRPTMVLDPKSGGYREVVSPGRQTQTTKKCPFCAEEVKVEAIKCKHCQSDLTAPTAV